jgi:hypothetical protein
MSNCTGVVYGAVTYGDGSPISPPQSLSAGSRKRGVKKFATRFSAGMLSR